MLMTITIHHVEHEKLDDKEREELIRLHNEYLKELTGGFLTEERLSPLVSVIARNEKGEMVAYMQHGHIEEGSDRVHLSEMYVKPEYRKQDIAKRMYEHLEQKARDAGLSVITSNPATLEGIRFFHKQGGTADIKLMPHEYIKKIKRRGKGEPAIHTHTSSISWWKRLRRRRR